MIYLEPKGNDPRYNTAFELFAFEEIAEKDDVFILWINEPCIVVGKNQNTYEEINQTYCDEHGIHIVRRISGGGAVYHDLNNLNYTIISNNSENPFDFKAMSQPVIETLAEMGVKAEFSGRNDLLIDDQKFCGNAQYIRGKRVMHHGCILFDVDISVLGDALKVSKDKIESKGKKSVRARVTNIKNHLEDQSITTEDFKNLLKDYMNKHYNMTDHELTEEEEAKVQEIKRTHNDSEEWIYGRNPDFTTKRARRLTSGKVEAYILIKDNVIDNIKFYGDFFGVKDVQHLSDILQGVKYTHDDIKKVLEKEDIQSYFMGITLEDIVDIIID